MKRMLNGYIVTDERKFFKFKIGDKLVVETKADTIEDVERQLTKHFNCENEDLELVA